MQVSEEEVLAALREVIDPEMGIDIVSMGLVYEIRIEGTGVFIKMTLTMRGCPMHDAIVNGVRLVLMNLNAVDDVEVELVWDPLWSPAMMTPEAQARLA